MKIGFLGCGNMGGALARAVRRADPSAVIILSDTDRMKRDALAAEVSARVADADAMIRESNYVFLGLKPRHTRNPKSPTTRSAPKKPSSSQIIVNIKSFCGWET